MSCNELDPNDAPPTPIMATRYSWILQGGYCVAWPMDTALYTHGEAAELAGISGNYAKGFIEIYETTARSVVQTPGRLDPVDFQQLTKLADGKPLVLQYARVEQ